jgi:hypothetical protein
MVLWKGLVIGDIAIATLYIFSPPAVVVSLPPAANALTPTIRISKITKKPTLFIRISS